jgi:hypothetical protein
MISKIVNWLKNKRLIRSLDVTSVPFVPVAQEDVRARTDVKNFNKSFDAQQQQMQARALVAHEPGCDVISCKKKTCFKFAADKIVKKTTVKMKRNKKDMHGQI